MKTAKILGLVVGGVIALVLVVLLCVWLFVNPNDYKPTIQAKVKQATGRDLTLSGDITLSVFPWVALKLGPASLGNPAGFPARPFLSFQHAAVRVKLLPLLSKRLEVGRLEIDGLNLALEKNADGRGNWQDFGKPTNAPAEADSAAPSKPGAALEGVEGVSVTNSRVSYQKIVVQNINLEMGAFADRKVVPVSLHADADRGVAGEHGTVDAKLSLTTDSASEQYGIKALNFNATVALAGSERPLHVTLAAPAIDVDLKAQTLALPAFDLNADGAHLSGGANGTKILDAPDLKGSVQLATLMLREFLPRLEITPPVTRDPKALSTVAFSGRFHYGDQAAMLDDLQVTLDDTHLKGRAGITNLDTNALEFALAVDRIDLDRYLPPANQAPAPTTPEKPADPSAKPLDAHGTLTVGSVHLSMLDLTDVAVTLAAKEKVIHVHPLQAKVYGGQYAGDITFDSRSTVPVLSMDEHLSGIDVGRLVASESKKVHVSGHGNVDIKATAHGAAADAIMKTLTGRFDLNVVNGAVEGMDLGFQLARAESVLSKQGLGNGTDTGRTKFDAFKMSADIVNGVATTKDLVISSAVLKVTGAGSANLPTQGLDFALLADTLRSAGGTPLKIPVKVTGTFTSPTVRPDVEALAKGALKQKAKDLLQDKLKSLFH